MLKNHLGSAVRLQSGRKKFYALSASGAENVPVRDFEAKIRDPATNDVGPDGRDLFYCRLRPVTSIHLSSDREAEFAPARPGSARSRAPRPPAGAGRL